jgi:hypothetical protein
MFIQHFHFRYLPGNLIDPYGALYQFKPIDAVPDILPNNRLRIPEKRGLLKGTDEVPR